ncbi:MAG TPA: hypothetical protein DCY13_15470 [Verrucomicrobiales bacterium]|nr:hypothetical protein [Verrucomicrobiales bacterium]
MDEVVPEPLGGAHNDPATTAANLRTALVKNLEDCLLLSEQERLRQRYEKFRALGRFEESQSKAA